MNIIFFEIKEEYEQHIISNAFDQATLYSGTIQEYIEEYSIEKLKEFEIVSVFIYSQLNLELLEQLPNIKLVSTRSTGKNHIDTQFCEKNNIEVVNVTKYGENTVAEFAFALLLTISRKIIPSISQVKQGNFDFTHLQGFDLCGKTVGIIGFGNIGQKFAQMCRGFEMNILAFDAYPEQVESKAKELGVTLASLNEILDKSDIISLHVPLFPQTHHLINKESISKMKKGVVLINTSRGELIDTQALLEGLEQEIISFVGLDVIEGECLMKEESSRMLETDATSKCDIKTLVQDHILINHSRVYLTPHNAFNTTDAVNKILNSTISQINEFLENNK
ncbi:MAG: NAD(P)-dependent oxidoreductase [Candidatus Nanoarchaeia archaeon]